MNEGRHFQKNADGAINGMDKTYREIPPPRDLPLQVDEVDRRAVDKQFDALNEWRGGWNKGSYTNVEVGRNKDGQCQNTKACKWEKRSRGGVCVVRGGEGGVSAPEMPGRAPPTSRSWREGEKQEEPMTGQGQTQTHTHEET
jgi:hypothetical protein